MKYTRRQAARQKQDDSNYNSLKENTNVINRRNPSSLIGRPLKTIDFGGNSLDSSEHFSGHRKLSKTPTAIEETLIKKTNIFFKSSEAILQFSKDFDLMRKKFGDILEKMQVYDRSFLAMNKQIDKLQSENIKLTSDIKVIRNEHTEMVHSVYKLEKKNEALVSENLTLKDMIY